MVKRQTQIKKTKMLQKILQTAACLIAVTNAQTLDANGNVIPGSDPNADEMDLDCPILKCEDNGLEPNVCY